MNDSNIYWIGPSISGTGTFIQGNQFGVPVMCKYCYCPPYDCGDEIHDLLLSATQNGLPSFGESFIIEKKHEIVETPNPDWNPDDPLSPSSTITTEEYFEFDLNNQPIAARAGIGPSIISGTIDPSSSIRTVGCDCSFSNFIYDDIFRWEYPNCCSADLCDAYLSGFQTLAKIKGWSTFEDFVLFPKVFDDDAHTLWHYDPDNYIRCRGALGPDNRGNYHLIECEDCNISTISGLDDYLKVDYKDVCKCFDVREIILDRQEDFNLIDYQFGSNSIWKGTKNGVEEYECYSYGEKLDYSLMICIFKSGDMNFNIRSYAPVRENEFVPVRSYGPYEKVEFAGHFEPFTHNNLIGDDWDGKQYGVSYTCSWCWSDSYVNYYDNKEDAQRILDRSTVKPTNDIVLYEVENPNEKFKTSQIEFNPKCHLVPGHLKEWVSDFGNHFWQVYEAIYSPSNPDGYCYFLNYIFTNRGILLNGIGYVKEIKVPKWSEHFGELQRTFKERQDYYESYYCFELNYPMPGIRLSGREADGGGYIISSDINEDIENWGGCPGHDFHPPIEIM